MTDYFSHSQMSFNSPLCFTPLSKSHWFFFIFGTLSSRAIPNPTLRNLTEKGGCSLWSRPQVPCMGFLRDTSVHWTFLTTTRHSSNDFGSALDFATFLLDVAVSRHSSNEFGSALDFATLLRFSLFEAVEKSVRYIIRASSIHPSIIPLAPDTACASWPHIQLLADADAGAGAPQCRHRRRAVRRQARG